tara:strand:- start:298 stop:585 length:288 start_codon:yes stop_codon:yes gene_type:complete
MINFNNDPNGIQITWDEKDPIESVFNDWSEDDFINAIRKDCFYTLQECGELEFWDPQRINKELDKEDYDYNTRLKVIAQEEAEGRRNKGNELKET